MKSNLFIFVLCASSILVGCKDESITPTGKACLGSDNSSLVEGLGNLCQKGDIVATKNPAYFCDFKSTVAFNSYSSAMCVYVGRQAEERYEDKQK